MPTISVRIEYEDGTHYEMCRDIPAENWDALHTPSGVLKPEYDRVTRPHATAAGRLVTSATQAMDGWINVAWKMKAIASEWRDR